MFIGILFSVIVSLSVSIFSFIVFFRRSPMFMSFAWFWCGMGFVWLFTATADLLTYMALRSLSLDATYGLQIFVGGSLVAAAHFLDSVLFGGRGRRVIVTLYSVAYALFLYTLFTFELTPRSESFFSTQNISPDSTLFIFTAMFLPLWFGALLLLWRALRGVEGYVIQRNFYILSALSFVFLGAAGSVDELGYVTGWMVTASRLVSLIAAIFATVAAFSLRDSEDLVV